MVTTADTPLMTEQQLIEQIMALNPTASVDFLADFSAYALDKYLAHLLAAAEPRGRNAHWARPEDSPAILLRISY